MVWLEWYGMVWYGMICYPVAYCMQGARTRRDLSRATERFKRQAEGTGNGLTCALQQEEII